MSFTTNRSRLRRKVLIGTSLLALGGFLAVGAASCVVLPDIDGDKCGNLVVEPNNGETCDENSESCGAPSSLGACRFLCDYQDATGIHCPPAFGCGLDGVCRKSGGLSDSPISIAGGGVQKLMQGDFDGDGRSDIVAVGFSTADVHFLTTEGYVERTVTLPNEKGFPGVGDVNGDTLSDIVLALNHSVGVLLGQEGRDFAPQSYTTMVVAPGTHKLVPIGAYSTDGVILSFSEEEKWKTNVEFITLDEDGGHARIQSDKNPLDGSLVGAVATKGVLSGNALCGAAAFELTGTDSAPPRVVLGQRCANAEITFIDYPFPMGYSPWGGVYFAEADKDGAEYLFFGLSNGNPSLNVRTTDQQGLPIAEAKFLDFEDGNCNPTFPSLASAPLAIGDVNGDTYPDVVDSRGILLYTPNEVKKFTRVCLESPPPEKLLWMNAVIGDFNGDGVKDVMASRVDDGVLDLWTWRPGGFNTVSIFVGGRVGELVAGDFDGDTISDAAFRFAPPGMIDMKGPSPLFAMFGNPLALPSPPQSLGYLNGMQHIAAGRVKGVNLAGQPDVISDLLVLSAAPDPMAPMAPMDTVDTMQLTFFQGNVTRNLTAPLFLQEENNLNMTLALANDVYGIFISEFGSSECDSFRDPNRLEDAPLTTPESIITLDSTGKIWLAGCNLNGSSKPAHPNLKLQDMNSFLFAPVDRSSTEDALAVFMTNPPFDDCVAASGLGVGTIESVDPNKEWSCPLDGIDSGIILPKSTNPDVPFAFVDLDDNGLRDVVVTGKTDSGSKIYVFWNGDATSESGFTSSKTTMSELEFPPPGYVIRDTNGEMGMPEDWIIKDIVGLNLDNDRFKEMAILTQGHVYFARLTLIDRTEEEIEEGKAPELKMLRPLELLPDEQNFADIRGGQALLAIDADSDGIDDLIVADTGKLLLYVGTERLK